MLSRDNSTRSFGIKVQNQGTEEPKPERVSKEILQKYLKLIKPLYVKVLKRYNDKVKFSGDGMTVNASPSSSPAVGSVGRRVQLSELVLRRIGVMIRCCNNMTEFKVQFFTAKDRLTRDGSLGVSVDGSMYSTRSSFEDEV
ncbi:putative membrane-associated kinase regulator [Trifolium repens]|nr:putative membrane-associated kinase regulator [Trifolium repens]